MSSLPPPRRRPRLRPVLVAALAVLAPLALPVAASADEAGAETVVGELVQVWPEAAVAGEHAHHGAEQPLSWVETAAGDAVPVDTDDVADLPVGATVQVTLGDRVDDADEGLEDTRSVLSGEVREAAPTSAVPPSNSVTVVRVVPAGGQPDGTDVGALVDAVDGPVADFWAGQTGGAVRFGVTGAHPAWVHTTAGCGDPAGLWNEAAAAAGFLAGPGRHLLVYVSSLPADLPGCAAALGQVGSGPGAGGRVYVRAVLPSLIAHEFGHNMGLGHSSGRQCDGALETGTCRTAGYRDYYDVMGASWEHVGSLNAAQAARLGVLPAAAQQALAVGDPAVTVTLAPLSGSSGTRAVRLDASDGAVYWLEHRAAAGQDGWLASAANRFRLDAGVLLHRSGDHADTSLLLDGTPSAAAGWDGDLQAALPLGVPVPVGGGAFTVTVHAVTDAGATLLVQPAARPVAVPPAGTSGGEAPDVLPAEEAGGARGGAAAGPTAVPAAVPAAAEVPPAAARWEAGRVSDAAPALESRSRSTSTTWLLPLLAGLAVTAGALAAGRVLTRARRRG